MAQCSEELRLAGKAYPRTCGLCGLGPCRYHPKPVAATPPASQQQQPAMRLDPDVRERAYTYTTVPPGAKITIAR